MITSIETALVVDDDALMREFIVETLKRNRITVSEASNGLDARHTLNNQEFDMAFVDMKMPGLDGMQVLNHIKTTGYGTLPVMVTAFGTVEKAVEAMKAGAFDFLTKPFSPEQVEIVITRAREWITLQMQNAYLKEELGWSLPRGRKLLGQAPCVQKLMKDIEQVAPSPTTVLISGESGTGKELIALALHSLSDRRNGPFVRMNCAAVPDTLMDSELFGHEKGAFTSAVSRRIGRFELAHKGTLLLDEVSEMNLGVQAKLLRVLQEHEFERVGGTQTIRADCRVVATTNRDLKAQVDDGKFRKDLFFRLNVVPLHAPSLRDRREDIPILADSFVKRFAELRGRKNGDVHFSSDAMEKLCSYSWPGNVRELENLCERLCVMENGPEFGSAHLPSEIANSITLDVHSNTSSEAECFSIPEMERRTIMRALSSTGGNRKRTAEILDISARTLRNKLSEYRGAALIPADA